MCVFWVRVAPNVHVCMCVIIHTTVHHPMNFCDCVFVDGMRGRWSVWNACCSHTLSSISSPQSGVGHLAVWGALLLVSRVFRTMAVYSGHHAIDHSSVFSFSFLLLTFVCPVLLLLHKPWHGKRNLRSFPAVSFPHIPTFPTVIPCFPPLHPPPCLHSPLFVFVLVS